MITIEGRVLVDDLKTSVFLFPSWAHFPGVNNTALTEKISINLQGIPS